MSQTVKNPPAVKETQVQSLDKEDPLEKGMATDWSILSRRISWAEEPGGLQSMGSQRVGYNWVTNTFTLLFHFVLETMVQKWRVLPHWCQWAKSHHLHCAPPHTPPLPSGLHLRLGRKPKDLKSLCMVTKFSLIFETKPWNTCQPHSRKSFHTGFHTGCEYELQTCGDLIHLLLL